VTIAITRGADSVEDHNEAAPDSHHNLSLRRYLWGVGIGFFAATIPYLWVLWDEWSGDINPFRQLPNGNFYDIQARSMLAGHLSVPPGSISFEAFVHGGRQYTYFGLFPSLLRIPVLVVTHGLDGRLTCMSMLVAWIATFAISALLLWRVRYFIRGPAVLRTAEAAVYGAFTAVATGGTTLIILAATPRVYEEELAWSVALMLGALFALLGVLERPSIGRVILSGAFTLFAALTRGSTGYACILGTILVAGWFTIGRRGPENRKWALPLLATALIPILLMVIVNLVKFGQPLGFSEAEQAWSRLDHHRQVFLAANRNDPFGLQFLPTTLAAYLGPGALHFTSVFPYVSLPQSSPTIVGHVVFDETDPTLSLLTSTPLLVVLSLWGIVTAFRRRAIERVYLTRIPLIAAAAASAGVLLFGYIALRYLADFLPFLILAAMIGVVDLFRRLWARRTLRVVVLIVLSLLAIFEVWTNFAVAVSPNDTWTAAQARSFVSAQSDLGAGALASHLVRSSHVPVSAAQSTLYDVDNCQGLYLSTGVQTRDFPVWRDEHSTWVAINQSRTISQAIRVVFHRPVSRTDPPVTLMTFGRAALQMIPLGTNEVRLILQNQAKPYPVTPPVSGAIHVRPGISYKFELTADPYLDVITASGLGLEIGPATAGRGQLHVVYTGSGQSAGLVTVTKINSGGNPVAFCQKLAHAAKSS